MASKYLMLFYVAISLCGIFFVLSILLFFVFDIPAVVGNLSGRASKKEIARIKMGAESTTDSKETVSNKKVTSKNVASMPSENATAVLSDNAPAVTSGQATMVLSNNADNVSNNGNATVVLSTQPASNDNQSNVTTVLSDSVPQAQQQTAVFEIEEDLMFSESLEIIGEDSV